MSSILPKNIQNVLVNDMTTSTSIITPFISTSNLISNTATIPTIMMTGSFHATHTNNTIANIFTTGGNVGIGTTSPVYTLDVNGSARFLDLYTNNLTPYSSNYININATTDTDRWIRFRQGGGTPSGHAGIIYSSFDNNHWFTYNSGGPLYISFNSTNTSLPAVDNATNYVTFATSGNVGIGTVSPAHKLDVIGTIDATTYTGANIMISGSIGSLGSIDAGTQFLGQPNDTIAAPSFSWTGDTNTGIYRPATDTLGFVTNGVERMRVSSSGNIGINTSPALTLDVKGSIGIKGAADWDHLYMTHSGAAAAIRAGGADLGLNLDVGVGGSGSYGGQTYKTVMTLMSTGNVGINTTSPAYTLDVNGDIRTFINATRSSLYLGNGTYDAAINLWDVAGAAWQLRTGSYSLMIGNGTIGSTINTQFTIVSSGNVGIGTNAPGTRLDVNGAGTIRGNLYVNSAGLGSTPTLNVSPSSNGAESSIGFWQNTANAGATWVVGHNTSGVGNNNFGIYSQTYGGNTLSILNSGYIGIGTNSPNYKLEVNGTCKITNELYVGGYMSLITTGNTRYHLYNNAGIAEWTFGQKSSARSDFTFTKVVSGTETDYFTISTGGNIGIGTTSPAQNLSVSAVPFSSNVDGGIRIETTGAQGTTAYRYSNLNIKSDSVGIFRLGIDVKNGLNTLIETISIPLLSGNVGIGTTSPAQKLEVNGNIVASGNGTTRIVVQNTTTGSNIASDGMQIIHDGVAGFLANYDNNPMHFIVNGNNFRMTINTAGNVGIGTTAPAYTLDVTGTCDVSTSITTAALFSTNITSTNIVGTNMTAGTLRFNNNGSGLIWGTNFSRIYDDAHLRIFTDDNLFFHTTNTTGCAMFIGTTNGNVGIGTTAPAHKLDVIGTIDATTYTGANIMISGSIGSLGSIDAGSQFLGQANDTIAAPSFSWTGDTNTGMYRPATDTLGFVTNGAERMRVSSAGNVGIGTSSPTATLDVNGNIRLSLSNRITTVPTDNFIYSGNTVGHYSLMWANETGNPAGPLALLSSYGGIRFFSLGLPRMIINSGGNIGIGTDAPGSKLHVFESSGTAAGANSGSIILDHDNSGGASSITFRSKVNRSSDYAYIQYQDAATVGGAGEASKFIIGIQNDADDHIILDPSGSVGIGTYSPGFKLHVNGNMRADNIYNNGWFRNYGDQGLYNEDYGCALVRNDAQYGNWRIYGNAINSWSGLRFTSAEISVMAGNGSNRECGFHYNNVGWGLYVDSSRNLFVPGNITAYWSDKRLKTNLQQLSNFDNVLTSLTGYSFNWNEKGQEILQKPSDETEIGLIAQDVQAVIPQAVTINKAGQKLDDPEPFEYLTINYDKIIPFLVEGYKAQRGEIQAQRGEIDELKSKIEHLEQLINKLT